MMPTSTDGVTGSTPETVLCKSLIHSYQTGSWVRILKVDYFYQFVVNYYSLQRQQSLSKKNLTLTCSSVRIGRFFLNFKINGL